MRTKKLILYHLIGFLSMLSTFYLYFGAGMPAFSLTRGYLETLGQGFITILILFLTISFVSLSYAATRVLYKKNFLRVSLILLVLLFLASIIGRIIELVNGNLCEICLINTFLYLGLGLINYFMLKDLHNLVKDLFQAEGIEL